MTLMSVESAELLLYMILSGVWVWLLMGSGLGIFTDNL
jgi:hypothetical protein